MTTSKLNLPDAKLRKTAALPSGAATTTTDPIRLHDGSHNIGFLAKCELKLDVPELDATQLPGDQSVTYTVEASDDPTFANGVEDLIAPVLQEGPAAGSTTVRVRPASTVKQYVRAKAVKVGAADASGAAMTLHLLF